jgi:hypothetical protein
MQNLVTQIQALSQPKDWGHLVSTLDNEGTLASLGGASAIGGILAQLNPQQHTVGFAVLLHVKTREDSGKENFDGGMETMRQARPAPRPSSLHQMARLLLCMHESELEPPGPGWPPLTSPYRLEGCGCRMLRALGRRSGIRRRAVTRSSRAGPRPGDARRRGGAAARPSAGLPSTEPARAPQSRVAPHKPPRLARDLSRIARST